MKELELNFLVRATGTGPETVVRHIERSEVGKTAQGLWNHSGKVIL
jgi:hypothetical protein